ncbi:CAAX protease self-immunity [Frankineae bacterium MT45]|nr:CAAX protease self-immunity [Frankineae bacterium MT45]
MTTAPPDLAKQPSRRRVVVAVGGVITLLVLLNVVDHIYSGSSLWLGPIVAVVLLAASHGFGLSWSELGLGRDRLGVGARWAAILIALVVAVYLVAVLIPLTRKAFLDDRYHTGVAAALFTAFVRIPLGTVLLEEVAFRSVLWGLLSRVMRQRWVLITTSLLFGCWHVLPSLNLAASNEAVRSVLGGSAGAARVAAIVGAVLFTSLGGLLFGELRRRSGSLLPSLGLHWATNALGVLFGLLAWGLLS